MKERLIIKNENRIYLNGDNSTWVDGKIVFYSDFLSKIKDQTKLIKPISALLRTITSVVIGFLLLNLWSLLYQTVDYTPEHSVTFFSKAMDTYPSAKYLIVIFLSYPLGLLASLFISKLNYKWLEEMFP